MTVNDATWRPHARLVGRVLQRLRVQMRQEEDVAASPRKTTETALDGGPDLILDLARKTVANALRMRCHLKNMHLKDFRRPNLALSNSPKGLPTFKLQEWSVAGGARGGGRGGGGGGGGGGGVR
jgi:hypothetical protein